MSRVSDFIGEYEAIEHRRPRLMIDSADLRLKEKEEGKVVLAEVQNDGLLKIFKREYDDKWPFELKLKTVSLTKEEAVLLCGWIEHNYLEYF